MHQGHQTFAILFRLNRQRSKNGKPAIYLRLTVDYKRIELATHQYVEATLWDHKAQCVKGKSEEAQAINRQLTVMKGICCRRFAHFEQMFFAALILIQAASEKTSIQNARGFFHLPAYLFSFHKPQTFKLNDEK